ncbi:glycoside hydrolase family 19 protein [Capnocytophaga bilenii]
MNKCYCNADFSAEDLKNIIKNVREKSNVVAQKQFLSSFPPSEIAAFHKKYPNYQKNPIYTYKGELVIKYGAADYYSLQKGTKITVDAGTTPVFYVQNKSDYTLFKDNLFHNNTNEKMSPQPDYAVFAKELNAAFSKYGINTCVRKIHFLAQCYLETFRFTKAYEDAGARAAGYKGGADFLGRGLIHLTNDYNYLAYYDAVNGTAHSKLYKNKIGEGVYDYISRIKNDPALKNDALKLESVMQQVRQFAPQLATNIHYAVDCAGWFWNKNNLNALADKDDVRAVSVKINGGTNGLPEREYYTKIFKEVMNFSVNHH